MKKSIMCILIMITMLLTACNTDTADFNTSLAENIGITGAMQEQMVIYETSVQESKAEKTNAPIDQENTDTTETSKTEADNTNVVAPDSNFLLKMFDIWQSDVVLENGKSIAYILGGSPAGSSKATYVDVDGDGIKEFCFIIDSYHGSAMYICNYVDNDWKIVDALKITGRYTYLQMNENGTTSLFAVVGVKASEGLVCYTYKNGIEEEFELLDWEKLYEELGEITDLNERDYAYYAAIEKSLKRYDNLTYLYDLPYVQTMLLYEARGLNDEGLRREDFDEEDVKRRLDEFTAEVAELFR